MLKIHEQFLKLEEVKVMSLKRSQSSRPAAAQNNMAEKNNNTAESALETRSVHDQHCTSQLQVCCHTLGTTFPPPQYPISESRTLFQEIRTSLPWLPSDTGISKLTSALCTNHYWSQTHLTSGPWVAAVSNKQSLVTLHSKFFENPKGKMEHKPTHCCILTLKLFWLPSGKYSTNLKILKTLK